MNSLFRRFAALFHRDRFSRDLDEEMQSHLDLQSGDLQATGLAPDQARLAARRQFGNVALLAEDSRHVWSFAFLERILRDIAFALRLLARNPGFTTAAVLTLALGVGANSAIFAVVDAFLFRPPSIPNSTRLVSLNDHTATHQSFPISYPNFLDWQRDNPAFQRMAAYRFHTFVFADESGAERTPGLEVSSAFFDVTGMHPALGRLFADSEHQFAAPPAVIISYELWHSRYSADPAVLGRTITVHDEPLPIVGVAPRGFRIGPRADLYVPLERNLREGRGSGNSLYGIARLNPGVTLEQARARMDAISRRLEELYPATNRGRRAQVVPFGQLRRAEVATPLLMLLAAVGLVLLIACTNISNLLLAKASGRGQELAIRRALGASRGRLIGQLLTESLVLSLPGGAAGLLVSVWASRALLAIVGDLDRIPGGAPLGGVAVDFRVVAFTMGVAVLTGLAMGLVPALHSSRSSPSSRSATRASRRTLDLLVACEVTLALVLLCGAGLLSRSLYSLLTRDRGFDASHVLTLSLADTGGRGSAAARARILEEIRTLPGVDSAAAAFPLPFGHGFSGDNFYAVWPARPRPRSLSRRAHALRNTRLLPDSRDAPSSGPLADRSKSASHSGGR